jgi:hypothetical protein
MPIELDPPKEMCRRNLDHVKRIERLARIAQLRTSRLHFTKQRAGIFVLSLACD